MGLTGLGSTAALVLVPVVGLLARPSFADVDKALASHDVAQAKIVLEALRERDGANARLSDATDAVALAEASAATGSGKLALLDAVASHHGARAPQAAAAAREARLAEIQRALDAKTPDAALESLSRWFPQGVPDGQVAELRAKADDLAFVACADDPCRFAAATAAKGAASTPEREGRVVSTRQGLLLALTTADVPGEDPLTRVNRLRALSATAVTAAGMTGSDPEIVDRAKKAEKWAQSGLAAVPLLGSQLSVVLALLDGKPAPAVPGKCVVVEMNLVCVSLDAQSRCKGIYVVGAEGSRKIQATAWSPDRIVSQAVGRRAAAPVPSPTGAAVTTRFDSGAPVLARWNRGELRELRIGDATP